MKIGAGPKVLCCMLYVETMNTPGIFMRPSGIGWLIKESGYHSYIIFARLCRLKIIKKKSHNNNEWVQ